MAKVRNLSDNQQEIAFAEFDFYQQYVETFKTSELARVRATAMEGSFGTQKEHYVRFFFGIHTANVVNLARRESVQVALAS